MINKFDKIDKFKLILIIIGALLLTAVAVFFIYIAVNYLNGPENLKNATHLDKFNDNNFFFEIDNVLTNKECDRLIKLSSNKLVRSKVMSVDKNNRYKDTVDKVRTSEQTWLSNSQQKDIVQKVENLVNRFVKNKITSKQFEDMQIARYRPSQEYKEHYDICHPTQAYPEHLKSCKEEFKKYNCVRYITVILYLNDGFKGGETEFPLINKKIVPKKGKALVFFNCNFNRDTHKNGMCDMIKSSKHAGLPVMKQGNGNGNGNINEKWIATIWIRAKEIN